MFAKPVGVQILGLEDEAQRFFKLTSLALDDWRIKGNLVVEAEGGCEAIESRALCERSRAVWDEAQWEAEKAGRAKPLKGFDQMCCGGEW